MKDREPSSIERRKAENTLRRVAVEADHQQDQKVKRWLKLADEFFTKDDDPNQSAA